MKKQRHCFANTGPSGQGCGFSVVMYGCESWAIKKAECLRIDAFKLVLEKTLESPWTERRSNQSVLKELIGKTEAEAETAILWPPDAKN